MRGLALCVAAVLVAGGEHAVAARVDAPYVEQKLYINAADNERLSMSLVDSAIARGDLDLSEDGTFKFSPLHVACGLGYADGVRKLLDAGADLEYKNSTGGFTPSSAGGTPLHTAAEFGRLDIVRTLILRGAEIDALDSFRRTPLLYAAKFKHPLIAKELLERGADRSVVEKNYSTTIRDKAFKRDMPVDEVPRTPGAGGATRMPGLIKIIKNPPTRWSSAAPPALGVWVTSEEALSTEYGRLETATKGRPSGAGAGAGAAIEAQGCPRRCLLAPAAS